MKRICLVVIVVCILAIIGGCGASSIEGKWVRYGDYAEGTTLQVVKVGDEFQANLVEVKGQRLTRIGFYSGDLVWRDVRKVAERKYEGLIITRNSMSRATNYQDASFELIDANKLYMRVVSSAPVRTGRPAEEATTYRRVTKGRFAILTQR